MEKTKNFTQGNPAKLLLFFALPLMVGNLFQQMYTLVDTIIVGQGVGVEALASLGASEWLCWLFFGLATGLTQGFSILFSQYYGAGKYEDLKKTIGNALVLSAAAVCLMVFCGQLMIAPALRLLKTPENIFAGSELYLRILWAGIPITLLYNFASALLRALGDSKTPLIAMVVAALVNIGLDLLFVMGFHWGIAGAAGATLFAQGCALLACLWAMKSLDCVHISRKHAAPEKDILKRLLILGVPVMFQNTIISVGGMVVQSVVNGFGFLFVAGFTATNKLYGLLEVAATSFGYAITTYVAQNYGAGNYERIEKGIRSGIIISSVTALTISALMLIFGKAILSLFVSGDPAQTGQVLDIARHYLNIMSYFLIVLYALYVYRSGLQGLGNTVIPMLSGLAEFIMRVTAAIIFPRFLGQEGIFYAEILAWTGAAVLLAVSYYVVIGRKRQRSAH
ncbi:MATE family efflux transporter [Parablautia intestinalis]|uniref:MATE family efflux transporter n=1 Tax=Parablautia intestinalis TaxID=2320100 RepID=UPI00256ED1D4|nr:MATE family efflux transporter [Parablautia intestinalis]